MATIPEHIVEKTWREVASFGFTRCLARDGEGQPALLAYVMAKTRDCGRDAQQLAVYLFFVALRMFDQPPGHRLERAAWVQAESQPHVPRYLTEAEAYGWLIVPLDTRNCIGYTTK